MKETPGACALEKKHVASDGAHVLDISIERRGEMCELITHGRVLEIQGGFDPSNLNRVEIVEAFDPDVLTLD